MRTGTLLRSLSQTPIIEIQKLVTAPSLARILTNARAFSTKPFTVIDVGCTGGILAAAQEFVPALRAVGFDPIVEEVDRLRAAAEPPGAIFECALVAEPGWRTPDLRKSPAAFARSSAAAYEARHNFDYHSEMFNSGREITLTSRTVGLKEWLRANSEWAVDLLKVDTDGNDISVLRSLGVRLTDPLAVHVEMNFDGDIGANSNVFSVVFETLLNAGFRMFSLDPTRYSKAAMPDVFEFSMPAQTVRGQVVQADALFCKDLAVEGNDSPARILKLACIFDLFNLQDCAAELLMAHEDVLAAVSPVPVTDLLTALGPRTELGLSPADARALFAKSPESFFPTSATEEPESGGATPEPDPVTEPSTADQRPTLEVGGPERGIGANGEVHALGEGWWPPEESGTWTKAHSASLHFISARSIPAGSTCELIAWRLHPPDDVGEVAITLNGRMLTVTPGSDDQTLVFLVEAEIPAGDLDLMIHGWPLQRPSELSVSADDRLLGVHVKSVVLRAGVGSS